MILKAADFGTKHTVLTHVETRRTVGGQLRQARSSFWFTRYQFDWTFSGLTKGQLNDFIAYAKANAGKIIDIVDENDITYHGIIISNPKIEQLTRNTHTAELNPDCPDNSTWNLSFVFEGATT